MLPIIALLIRARRLHVLISLQLVILSASAQQVIRFGVLGLFHPQELLLEPESRNVRSVTSHDSNGQAEQILNGEAGHRQIVFRVEEGRVIAGSRSARSWTASARDGSASGFRLIVPGKIRRFYFGKLIIQAQDGELVAIVEMERETAVASVVASEMVESAPLEALKAQAVATRSFLTAGPRHGNFDFCDTTHCQFLKSPPASDSRVAKAVEATRGLALAYRGKPVAAMYSSRCGGQTRSLRDVGMEPGDAYPYYSVSCAWCRRHPLTWQSKIGPSAQPPQSTSENQRIIQARQWGWGAIPGSGFKATAEGAGWHLEGHSLGHGVGMCQHGAGGMAASGADYHAILAHYYPNTSEILLP
ncbi:MAG: SpoIID/LytB domain-containing protein [Terracidiphilus sp.]|jgi:peptidoglycan hydrolase-like amidase